MPGDGVIHLLCCQFIAAAVDAMYATEAESVADEAELEQGILVKSLVSSQICLSQIFHRLCSLERIFVVLFIFN